MKPIDKWIWICIGLLIGIIIGIVIQQYLVTLEVAKAFSYTNIQINFNETKLVNEFNQTIVPQLKQMLSNVSK